MARELSAIQLAQLDTAPGNPPDGYQSLYVGADGRLHQRTSAGADSVIGSDLPFPLAGYGLLAASGDPAQFLANSTVSNGETHFARVWIPAGVTITNLWVAVRTAGTYTTSSVPNQLAVYDDSGNRLGITTNSNTLFTSAGWRGGPIGTPVAAQQTGRFVYIGFIVGGMSSALSFPFLTAADDNHFAWFGIPVGGGNRRSMWLAGQSSLPTSFNPASYGNPTAWVPLFGVT